mgnify:CR=1 FL=1
MATTTTAVPVEDVTRLPSESQMAIVLRRFRKHKIAMVSLGVGVWPLGGGGEVTLEQEEEVAYEDREDRPANVGAVGQPR